MLLFMVFIFIGLCGCMDEDEIPEVNKSTITVILRECEGMTITDEQPMKTTTIGGTVSFTVKVDEDYYYLGNSAGATYNARTGKVKLSRIYYPATIDLVLLPKSELYKVEFYKNINF